MIPHPPPAVPKGRVHPEHYAIAAIVSLACLGGVAACFDVSVWQIARDVWSAWR